MEKHVTKFNADKNKTKQTTATRTRWCFSFWEDPQLELCSTVNQRRIAFFHQEQDKHFLNMNKVLSLSPGTENKHINNKKGVRGQSRRLRFPRPVACQSEHFWASTYRKLVLHREPGIPGQVSSYEATVAKWVESGTRRGTVSIQHRNKAAHLWLLISTTEPRHSRGGEEGVFSTNGAEQRAIQIQRTQIATLPYTINKNWRKMDHRPNCDS